MRNPLGKIISLSDLEIRKILVKGLYTLAIVLNMNLNQAPTMFIKCTLFSFVLIIKKATCNLQYSSSIPFALMTLFQAHCNAYRRDVPAFVISEV